MHSGLELGIQCFNDRDFYKCHEVLEDVWMEEHGPSRLFIQSIIHFAVAFYHHGRQNPVGAVRQFEKGLDKMAGYLPDYEGIDSRRLYDECARCLEAIHQDQPIPGVPFIHPKPLQ